MRISRGTSVVKGIVGSTLGVIHRVVKDIILRRIDDRYVVGVDAAFTITGFSEHDNCVYLRPNQSLPLYGISLSSGSNLPNAIGYFQRLVETYGANEDARLFCFYTKSAFTIEGQKTDFCTKQNLYIFSHSKILLQEIAQYYSTTLMSPKSQLRALLEIGLNAEYYSDMQSLEMKSYLEVLDIPIDKMAYLFRTLFAEGIYGAVSKSELNQSNKRLYQGVGTNSFFAPSKPDMIGAMQEEWKGYLCFILEINTKKVEWEIKQRKNYVSKIELDKEVKEGYKMIEKEFEKNPSHFLLMNCMLVTDNQSTIQNISEALNINFVEKKLYAKDILYNTPIKERDLGYDFIISSEDAKKFIVQIHRYHNPQLTRPAEICGRDVNKNYTVFSFYESAVPHTAIIAKSRSGKTVYILGLIAQALRAKIIHDPNYIEDHRDVLTNSPVVVKSAERLGKEIGIVQFDIGYSGLKWITQLERCLPKQVNIYSDDLNKLRFGLTDVRTFVESGKTFIDKTDGLFLTKTISSLLELNGEVPLTTHESQAIIDVLAELYANKSYKGLTFGQLKEIGGYETLLSEIESELGSLDDYASTTEVVLSKKLSFCQVPLLADIIRVLKIRSKAQRIEQAERDIFLATSLKIKALAEDPFFGYYNRSNIPSLDYFYMELESLKKLGDNIFIPIYLMVFQQQYRKDIAKAQEAKNNNRPTIEKIYIMEEAHNLFKISSIASFFGEVVREAARYGIVFVFITQNAEDIPSEILLNLGNRILMPAPGKDRENQIAQLSYFWQTSDESNKESKEENANFFKRYSKQYTAVIKNANGVFMLEQFLAKEEIWLFNSDAVSVKLKDMS